MMNLKRPFVHALNMFFIPILILACGSGGSGSAGIDGSGGPTVAVGPIEEFGSIILNGKKYETDSADFVVRGEVGRQSDLDIGQYVTIITDPDAEGLVAEQVIYFPSVTGPVASVNLADSSFTVFGLTIMVTGDTLYGENIVEQSLQGISEGMAVTVSGSPGANNVLWASRVERIDVFEFDIAGSVQELDADLGTFTIGLLTVEFNDSIGQELVQDGVNVWVSGVLSGDQLSANIIQLRSDQEAQSSAESVEIVGFVSGYTVGTEQFFVSGRAVSINSDTAISGNDNGELGNDSEVVVVGAVVDGVLVADFVIINGFPIVYDTNFIERFEASVEGGDVDTLIVGGRKYFILDDALITDRMGNGRQLSDFEVGDLVNLEFRPSLGSGGVIVSSGEDELQPKSLTSADLGNGVRSLRLEYSASRGLQIEPFVLVTAVDAEGSRIQISRVGEPVWLPLNSETRIETKSRQQLTLEDLLDEWVDIFGTPDDLGFFVGEPFLISPQSPL